MAKYDWAKLKREYMLGDYKSLRAFAKDKGIPYNQHFLNSTKGWAEESRRKAGAKQEQIIKAVTEQEVRYEIDRNAAHLAVGDLIMAKLNLAISGIKPKDRNAAYQLQAAAATLEKIQKSQRLGEGVKDDNTDNGLMEMLQQAAEGINLDELDKAELEADGSDELVDEG